MSHRVHLALAALSLLLPSIATGCGTAKSITAAAACNTLILSIGEAQQLEAERAVADIRTVSSVCRRLEAMTASDAGVDGAL